jgi:hypothetical protein
MHRLRSWLPSILVEEPLALMTLGPPLALDTSLAWAGTVTGTAVTICGLATLTATVDTSARLAAMDAVLEARAGLPSFAVWRQTQETCR